VSTVTPEGNERKGRTSDGAYCTPSGVIISCTSIATEIGTVPSDESMNALVNQVDITTVEADDVLLHLLPHWSIFRKATNIPVDCPSLALDLTTVLTCPVGNITLLDSENLMSIVHIECCQFLFVTFEQHPRFTSRTEINRMLYRCSLVLSSSSSSSSSTSRTYRLTWLKYGTSRTRYTNYKEKN